MFFGWLNKPKKTLLEVIEEKVDQEILSRFVIDPVENILSKENIFIYSCRMENLKVVTQPVLELDNLKMFYLKNSVCISDEKNILFITTNSLSGSLEILDFISETFCGKIKQVKEKIEIAKHHLKRIMNINMENIERIKNNFNDVILNNDSLDLFVNFKPSKLIHGNPAILSDIPSVIRENIPSINRIKIYIDSNGMINSVVLFSNDTDRNIHPNAEDGWYCLGSFKGKELCESNVLNLINSVKIININDCYFVPDYLEFYVKKEKNS